MGTLYSILRLEKYSTWKIRQKEISGINTFSPARHASVRQDFYRLYHITLFYCSAARHELVRVGLKPAPTVRRFFPVIGLRKTLQVLVQAMRLYPWAARLNEEGNHGRNR